MTRRTLWLLFAGLSLAACNRQAVERQQAAGEILEGSVSDAMIHTDQVRSEGPFAAPKAGKGEKEGRGGKGAGKATAAVPDAVPTPESSPSATVAAPPEPTPSATE